MLYTLEQLTELAASVKAPNPKLAASVAMAETGLRYPDGIYYAKSDWPGDENLQDDIWGPSYGFWQIRSLKADYGTGRIRDGSRLEDPLFNAKAMMEISKGGTDFSAWTTFKTGKHKIHYGDDMAWRLAPCLIVLRNEVNTSYKDRPKQSDGTIGDAAHRSRKSDHNPNSRGVVSAWDCTKDTRFMARLLEVAKADPRTEYIIWEGKNASLNL